MDFWRHLKTVQRHRHLVRQYCFRLGLYWQGLTHDLSKFSPVEFWAGVKYFQGDRSPNDAQRRDKGYSASWMHHKGRNRHHFEYWTDYGVSGEGIIGVEMPKKYVAEMFCDRLAASKVYRGQDFHARAAVPLPGCSGRAVRVRAPARAGSWRSWRWSYFDLALLIL